MAESRSPGSSTAPPVSDTVHPPAQNDWELLSMSASTLGSPQPAKRDCGGDMVMERSAAGWDSFFATGEKNEEAGQTNTGPHTHVDTPSAGVSEDFCAEKEEVAEEELSLSLLKSANSDDTKAAHDSKAESKCGVRSRKFTVLWSIGVAATMVGIVILGYRWHLACCHNQQLQVELSDKDEKLSDLTNQFNRLKQVVGGYQKASAARE